MSACSDYIFNGDIHIIKNSELWCALAMNTPTGAVYTEEVIETSFAGEDSMGHRRSVKTMVFIPGVFWDGGKDCFVKIGAK